MKPKIPMLSPLENSEVKPAPNPQAPQKEGQAEKTEPREGGQKRVSIAVLNASKTHCDHGHEFTPENTRYSRGNRRNCIACQKISSSNWNERRRIRRKAESKPDNRIPIETYSQLKEAVDLEWLSGKIVKRSEMRQPKKGKCQPIFSEEDADLNDASWAINRGGYAKLTITRNRIQIAVMAHHIICLRAFGRRPDPKIKECTDHINRIRLDNRRENLRIVGPQENAINTSRVPLNVLFLKKSNMWKAQFQFKKNLYYCGCFKSKADAISAVSEKRKAITTI